jgi:hypothetical protein
VVVFSHMVSMIDISVALTHGGHCASIQKSPILLDCMVHSLLTFVVGKAIL